MDRVAIGPVKGLRLAVAAFVLSVVLALSGAGVTTYLLTRESASTKDFATELRNGLVVSCEANGNPLREAVQQILREQIRRSETTPARFFPNIPPALFHRLVAEQARANRAAIERIAPVDCPAQYPQH